MNQIVYLYVFDTMSDWEIGYITAELNSGRYFKKGLAPIQIVTVGRTKTPVVTMGGLKIIPDITLEDCKLEHISALILSGGNTWGEPIHNPILKQAKICLEKGILVAAICGATIGLAGAGLLDTHWHTSNDLEYLKMVCSNYKGERYYKIEPAVTDQNLITASGVAPLEFCLQVLKVLDVCSIETLKAWYRLNKTQEGTYFYELMSFIQ